MLLMSSFYDPAVLQTWSRPRPVLLVCFWSDRSWRTDGCFRSLDLCSDQQVFSSETDFKASLSPFVVQDEPAPPSGPDVNRLLLFLFSVLPVMAPQFHRPQSEQRKTLPFNLQWRFNPWFNQQPRPSPPLPVLWPLTSKTLLHAVSISQKLTDASFPVSVTSQKPIKSPIRNQTGTRNWYKS